ncbi:hypothetical protein JMJ77_0008015, partial [Colletotrichum scovillei]
VETPHDPAPSSQLCLPPAPAPARTPALAGGVARTLHWDSIGLDEFLAGLTSRHLPPNDPRPRYRPPRCRAQHTRRHRRKAQTR